MLHKYGIEQRWLMIVGYPTETNEDFEQTIEILKMTAHMAQDHLFSVSVSTPFMALDKSPIFKHHGMDTNDQTNPWTQHFWTTPENPANTFNVRAARWRRLAQTVEELGIPWGRGTQHKSFMLELNNLEKFYNERGVHA